MLCVCFNEYNFVSLHCTSYSSSTKLDTKLEYTQEQLHKIKMYRIMGTSCIIRARVYHFKSYKDPHLSANFYLNICTDFACRTMIFGHVNSTIKLYSFHKMNLLNFTGVLEP